MNKTQKIITCIALFFFALTLFNAPWNVQRNGLEYVEISAVWKPPYIARADLAIGSLMVEWAGIVIVAGALWTMTRTPKRS